MIFFITATFALSIILFSSGLLMTGSGFLEDDPLETIFGILKMVFSMGIFLGAIDLLNTISIPL